jgi:hypothetical protein
MRAWLTDLEGWKRQLVPCRLLLPLLQVLTHHSNNQLCELLGCAGRDQSNKTYPPNEQHAINQRIRRSSVLRDARQSGSGQCAPPNKGGKPSFVVTDSKRTVWMSDEMCSKSSPI